MLPNSDQNLVRFIAEVQLMKPIKSLLLYKNTGRLVSQNHL